MQTEKQREKEEEWREYCSEIERGNELDQYAREDEWDRYRLDNNWTTYPEYSNPRITFKNNHKGVLREKIEVKNKESIHNKYHTYKKQVHSKNTLGTSTWYFTNGTVSKRVLHGYVIPLNDIAKSEIEEIEKRYKESKRSGASMLKRCRNPTHPIVKTGSRCKKCNPGYMSEAETEKNE